MTPSRTPTVHGGEHVSRIDDARAAELDRRLSLATWRNEIQMGEVERLLADRADYKARIEDLTRERDEARAKLQPVPGWRQKGESDPHGTTYDCDQNGIAGGHLTDDQVAYQTAMLMRSDLNHEAVLCIAKDRIRWLSRRIHKLESQLSTPSPTDAPASDTRGLAVEAQWPIGPDDKLPCDVMVAPRTIFRKGVRLSTLFVGIAQRLKPAYADHTMIDLPTSPDTDRKLARAVEAERERCAKIAERDCDWAQFGIEKAARNGEYLESDPTERAVTVYRAGIQAGQMIAIAIRTEPRQGASRPCDAYGGCPDRSTCAGYDLTTAPAEAERAQ